MAGGRTRAGAVGRAAPPGPPGAPRRRWAGPAGRWLPVAAAAIAAALYAPALGFGPMWDDPDWLRRAATGAWRDVLGGLETFQFYRPLTVWTTRLWAAPDGGVRAVAWHAAQVGWHAVAAALVVVFTRQCTGRARIAALAGLLFAVSPLAHQPVAWAAAHQPLSVALNLVALVAWAGGGAAATAPGRRWAAPTVSVAAYAGALLSQESAVTTALVFPLVDAVRRRRPRWPVHLALAAAFVVAWQRADRLDAYVGGGYDLTALAMLAQAPIWPLAMWLAPFAPDWLASGAPLRAAVVGLTLAAAAAGLAAASAWAVVRRRTAILALTAVWALPILATVWARLDWAYLRSGQRLAYPALPAIAIAWAVALDAGLARGRLARRRWIGAAVAATAAVAIGAVARLHGVHAEGARYLAPVVSGAVVAGGSGQGSADVRPGPAGDRAADARTVVVNFPDRIALRRGPLPLGWWGMPVAPVSLDLAQFADWRRVRMPSGASREVSCAVPALDDAARNGGPWRVDLRGAPGDGAALVGCALAVAPAAVVVARPGPGGPTVASVGAIAPAAARESAAADGAQDVAPCPARPSAPGALRIEAEAVGLSICAAAAPVGASAVRLTTRWSVRAAPPPAARTDVTLFVHAVSDDGTVSNGDGDLLGGALPLDALPPAGTAAVDDVRTIAAGSDATGGRRVHIGLYRRRDGWRVPITAVRWTGRDWRHETTVDAAAVLTP